MEILILLLTLIGLAVGGHLFVLAASAIGRRCGMSHVLIGATIIAIGTSLPEWAVSVGAAWKELPGLSVGNVVGSNVCNMGIVLGLAALITPLAVTRRAVARDGLFMLLATGMLLVMAVEGSINRLEGVLLLVMALVVIVVAIATGRSEPEAETRFRWWDIPLAIFGLALVIVSSHFFVEAAEKLATRFGVSEWIIGITVAAIGTSLPELVTSLAAAAQKQHGIIVGNVLGSSTMNIFFVLGSAATIREMDTTSFTMAGALVFAAMMVLPVVFLATQWKLVRWEGAVLLLVALGWYVQQTQQASGTPAREEVSQQEAHSACKTATRTVSSPMATRRT